MQYPLKLYIVAEEKTAQDKANLLEALKRIKADFEVVSLWGLEWAIEYRDKIQTTWIANSTLGTVMSSQDIIKEAKKVKDINGEQFHSICFLFKAENWPATYGGLNVGGFYSGHSVQLVKWYNSSQFIYEVLVEELAHCIDEQIYRELGISLEKYLNLNGDVDSVVVHAEGHGWERKKYRPFFIAIAPLLFDTFRKRYDRWQQELKLKVGLLEKIKMLYEQIILLKREIENKKKPIE